MKKDEIKVGGFYLAEVNGKLVTVHVDEIVERTAIRNGRTYFGDHYHITNLSTGRKPSSAQKLSSAVKLKLESHR